MDQQELQQRFATLTTAHLADACVRGQVPLRAAPAGLQAVLPGSRMAGRVCPARHVGSVDVFLEAYGRAAPGDVLVVDNDGRSDEACIGDLAVLEAQSAGLGGLVVWGLHRDTADILAIGLPVFSMGATPAGPHRLDERPDDAFDAARMGELTVTGDDLVFADDDGVLFVSGAEIRAVLTLAESIRDTERHQAEQMRAGVSLRQQTQFDRYLAQRGDNPNLTFRDHLLAVGGAIEV